MTNRKSINEIIPGKLYQRGQILTWPLKDKFALIEEYNIGLAINLWPKLDPDMSNLPCMYWYLPSTSQDMLSDKIGLMAETAATFIMENYPETVLVMCEAGKTRSVFFAGLMLLYLKNLNGSRAIKYINDHIPGHKMKPYMIDYLEEII